jgi:hypothetical protein
MAKKYNNNSRVQMIDKKFNDNINDFLLYSYINVILTLDYNTYKVTSKGKGFIGSIEVEGKTYYVNEVSYDKCTKGVVFSLLPNTENYDEFWIDEMNYRKFKLSDFNSMLQMLAKYFKSGNVYAYDTEKMKPLGNVLRKNDIKHESFKSNINLIKNSLDLLTSVASKVQNGISTNLEEK